MKTQEYLQDLFHLEASCYEQRQIIRSLREQLHFTQSSPDREHIGGRYKDDSGLGLYIFVIPIFAAIIVDIFAPSWIAIGIGAIILFFQWYLTYPKEAIEYNKRERARVVAENQKIDEQNRLNRERKPALCAALSEQIAYAEASLSITKQTLESLYGLNLIYPKYRNYTAIASFYEYFCSGRCKELTGHEGAYNIFEQEVRMGIIIDKLDAIFREKYTSCFSVIFLDNNTKQSDI